MKKFIGLLLTVVAVMSMMVVTASAASLPLPAEEIAQLRAEITAKSAADSVNASDEVILPNHFDSHHISAHATCNHVGTEKVTTRAGSCYFGSGFVYKITCKPCGAFVGAMCTNVYCTYWD